MKRFSHAILLVSSVLFPLGGCDRAAPAARAVDAGAKPEAGSKVAKIVFIDQKECCDCTRKRIEGSWAALQKAIGSRTPAIPIERIHRDTQGDLDERWSQIEPYMAIPAVYLVDANGAVVSLLQGEITAEQFKKALK
jgi:hypothetical protein